MLDKFITYFVKRHLLTNLIFLTGFLLEVFFLGNILKKKKCLMLRLTASVSLLITQARTAEEVEHFVTRPLEEEVSGLDGVYQVTSTASQGSTTVFCRN